MVVHLISFHDNYSSTTLIIPCSTVLLLSSSTVEQGIQARRSPMLASKKTEHHQTCVVWLMT